MTDQTTPTPEAEEAPFPRPAEFVDLQGRTWQVTLTYSSLRRLRMIGVDLLTTSIDGRVWLKLGEDLELLARALWVVCADQANEMQVSEEAFGAGLAGETLAHAARALEVAYLNFSPPVRRRALSALLTQVEATQEAQAALTAEKLSGDQAQALIKAKMQQAGTQIDRELAKQTQAPLPPAPKATPTPAPPLPPPATPPPAPTPSPPVSGSSG